MIGLEELRRRLAEGGEPRLSVYGDEEAKEGAPARRAAVLLPVVVRAASPTLLFTLRTSHLRTHSGQVSFPGGSAEPEDPTPEFTALRETSEEIGVPPERVEVLGKLPEYLTRTGYRITPVVGLLRPPLELAPDPGEVEEVFEVPLAFLLDPRNEARESREVQGRRVGYSVFRYEGRVIWGATAGMLVNLRLLLARGPGAPE